MSAAVVSTTVKIVTPSKAQKAGVRNISKEPIDLVVRHAFTSGYA